MTCIKRGYKLDRSSEKAVLDFAAALSIGRLFNRIKLILMINLIKLILMISLIRNVANIFVLLNIAHLVPFRHNVIGN